MPRKYLKKATLTAKSDATDVHDIVMDMLTKIEAGGDETAIEYAMKLDKYDGHHIYLTSWRIQLLFHRLQLRFWSACP